VFDFPFRGCGNGVILGASHGSPLQARYRRASGIESQKTKNQFPQGHNKIKFPVRKSKSHSDRKGEYEDIEQEQNMGLTTGVNPSIIPFPYSPMGIL